VIELVLATDMSNHFQQIKAMKNLLTVPDKYADSSLTRNPCSHIDMHTHAGSTFHNSVTLTSESMHAEVLL